MMYKGVAGAETKKYGILGSQLNSGFMQRWCKEGF